MRRLSGLRAVVLLAGSLAAACASTGSMSGEISSPGSPPRHVTLSYVANRSGDSGYMSVTLPGGETFNGPYARVGSAAAVGPGLDIDFSVVDWGQTADTWAFGPTDTDKVVALLQGSRGSKIRCRFTLLYPSGGMRDGGSGDCQVNTGGKIDVRF